MNSKLIATLPRAIARLTASQSASEPQRTAALGFTASAIVKPQPSPEPRKVPLGFVPGATVNQITIAR